MDDFPKLVNREDDSVIRINNSSFSIGRSQGCDHIVPSLGVSRFHCFIKKHGDKWCLYDRSSNGTFVNSTHCKFNEYADLKDGDIIKLGENLSFIFQYPKVQSSEETVVLEDIAAEFEQPFEIEGKPPEIVEKTESVEKIVEKNVEKAGKSLQQDADIMENEFTCSICSELFIKAVTLNCSHTYCKYCIDEWRKTKSTCPICRNSISSVTSTLVLNNAIEKMVNAQSEEMQQLRKELIKQREEEFCAKPSSSTNQIDQSVIEILSENDDYDYDGYGESDYSDMSDDYDDYDCDYDSRPYVRSRAYYGGYGRCFICNEPGHWANSCPLKRR